MYLQHLFRVLLAYFVHLFPTIERSYWCPSNAHTVGSKTMRFRVEKLFRYAFFRWRTYCCLGWGIQYFKTFHHTYISSTLQLFGLQWWLQKRKQQLYPNRNTSANFRIRLLLVGRCSILLSGGKFSMIGFAIKLIFHHDCRGLAGFLIATALTGEKGAAKYLVASMCSRIYDWFWLSADLTSSKSGKEKVAENMFLIIRVSGKFWANSEL